MTLRSQLSLSKLLSLAALVAFLHAAPAFGETKNPEPGPRVLFSPSPFVISDFDNDNKLDKATLSSNGSVKTVRISFGRSASTVFTFDSFVGEHGTLLSGDIDHDGDIDLVWIAESVGKFITWLGDGRGNFSQDDSSFNLGQIEDFFRDSRRGLVAQDRAPGLVAILPVKSILAPTVFTHGPPASVPSPLFGTETPHADSLFWSDLQPRGPPSNLF